MKKLLLLFVILLSGCATSTNIHINLREEMNKSVREGFGSDAVYFLDTIPTKKAPRM